jgi:hypothetical protein
MEKNDFLKSIYKLTKIKKLNSMTASYTYQLQQLLSLQKCETGCLLSKF